LSAVLAALAVEASLVEFAAVESMLSFVLPGLLHSDSKLIVLVDHE
jgi:hypothetical protein